MSFRKRNVGIPSSSHAAARAQVPASPPLSAPRAVTLPRGVRPSPIDGRPTTSTGTPSLDEQLAGHGGLALGTSILLEENGTTDYAGILLKFYAAEGLVQGHTVHVIGVSEPWAKELPGLVGAHESAADRRGGDAAERATDKMKIAWRYERLAQSGAEVASSRESPPSSKRASIDGQNEPSHGAPPSPFCHTFDLTKKLAIPANAQLHFLPVMGSARDAGASSPSSSPFAAALQALQRNLAASSTMTTTTPPSGNVHRVVIPAMLSPALYPPHACQPQHLLQFLHALRAMLRDFAGQLTAMAALPLDLYPRCTGLVRWAELLSDGVVELTPLPYQLVDEPLDRASGGGGGDLPAGGPGDQQPQGILQIHSLPVYHEKGGGGGGALTLGDNLAFTVSRKRFMIRPFRLPPVDGGGGEPQAEGAGDRKPSKQDLEF